MSSLIKQIYANDERVSAPFRDKELEKSCRNVEGLLSQLNELADKDLVKQLDDAIFEIEMLYQERGYVLGIKAGMRLAAETLI